MSCTCVALLATAAHAWEASIGADALHAMSFTAEPKGGDVTTVDCISISDGIDDYWCSTTCSQGKCPENVCQCDVDELSAPEILRESERQGYQKVGCPSPWWCPPGERNQNQPKPKPQIPPHEPNPAFKDWPEQKAAPKKAKNVLMIVVDDLRTQLNVAYGHKFMKTPSLDAFVQSKGTVTFTRAYAQVAHCAPSRNSFMTSRYPDTLKIWNVNAHFRDRSTAADPIFPIPQWFKRNGYNVFGGGKIYHPNHPPLNDRPFSWSAGTRLAGEIRYFNDPDHGCPEHPWENKVGCGGCAEDKPVEEFYDGRLANWTIGALRAAKQDLDQGEKKPFFIAAGFRRPHTPWNVAQRFVDMYKHVDPPRHNTWPLGAPPCAFVCGGDGVGCDFGIQKPRETEQTNLCRRMYYACVSATDHYVGEVLNELNRLELYANTVVAVFSDHGWHLGEGGLWAKYTNTELSTRVPLMIRAPWLDIHQKSRDQRRALQRLSRSEVGVPDGVTRANTFVELVDVYPTLVELAGVPMPPKLEGRSLFKTMKRPYDHKHRSSASSQFAHCCSVGLFDAHRECGACEKLPNERISYMGYAVRNSQYRFVAWYKWDGQAAQPACEGLMAVELYKHEGDTGRGDKSFDDFEYVNIAANLSLGAELHKLKGEPTGIAAQTLVRWKKDLTRPHASAVKYLHEDLLNKFSKAFDRCHPAVAVQKHWHRPRGSKSSADDGALDAARFNPFEDEDGGTWPPDKSCPNPE